ncbi:MAG: phosphodiesterase [Oscillospiraceae bacterium]|nr:phosphodiesterase [Oscillospiraceae bacterium]
MKLMIASDIHGSLYYCEKMREAYEREKADKLILLGDLLYHGPRNDLPKGYDPKGVIALLNGMKSEILCVRGNCEAEVDQMVLEFPIMSDSMILYLEGRMVFATHGHLFNSERLPMLKKGDILLHGHTHVQALKDCGDHLYLNPGSVSIPKEGNQNSYMIYENGCFAIRNLEGGEIGRLAL